MHLPSVARAQVYQIDILRANKIERLPAKLFPWTIARAICIAQQSESWRRKKRKGAKNSGEIASPKNISMHRKFVASNTVKINSRYCHIRLSIRIYQWTKLSKHTRFAAAWETIISIKYIISCMRCRMGFPLYFKLWYNTVCGKRSRDEPISHVRVLRHLAANAISRMSAAAFRDCAHSAIHSFNIFTGAPSVKHYCVPKSGLLLWPTVNLPGIIPPQRLCRRKNGWRTVKHVQPSKYSDNLLWHKIYLLQHCIM